MKKINKNEIQKMVEAANKKLFHFDKKIAKHCIFSVAAVFVAILLIKKCETEKSFWLRIFSIKLILIHVSFSMAQVCQFILIMIERIKTGLFFKNKINRLLRK